MSALPKSGEVYYADDGTMSIVLEDTYDPTYEPPEKEVNDYAKWLGIDVETEPDLIWIARDGLKAPLPSEWKPCKTDTGDVYYFNFKTGDSIWDHPMDDIYKKRVEDERAKLKSGKSSGPAKLVKGGAGNVEEKTGRIASALNPGGGAGSGRTAIEENRPRMGRLGAIGSSDDSKPLRPDISDLVPPKGEQAATALFGKKKEPLKDFKEMERNLRKRYDTEFEALQSTLQEKHNATLADLESKLANEVRSAKNNAKTDLEDEVEAAKRNGERRNKREIGLYEDSVEKQKEDLRRTLRTLQEKLEADTQAVQRRVETELSEKRSATERNMALDIGRTRKDIQDRWQAEKTTVEMQTQSQLRDLRAAHELKIDVAKQEESRALSQRVLQLQDALVKEMDAVRQEVNAQRHAQSQRLREEAANKDTAKAAALSAANAQHKAAVDAAMAQSAEAVRVAREEATRAMDSARADFTTKKESIQREALLQSQQSAAEAQASRKVAAERRVADYQTELAKEMEDTRRTFESETERLVADARLRAQSSADEVQQIQETAKANRLQDLQRQHDARMAAIRTEHQDRMRNAATAGQSPAVQQELQARLAESQRKWLAENPAPVLLMPSLGNVPTFDPSSITVEPIIVRKEVEATPTAQQISALVQEEVSKVRQEQEREATSRREDLERSLQRQLDDELQQHRDKALADVEQRLQTYRAQGGSPLRASKSQQQQPPPPMQPSAATNGGVPIAEADGQVSRLRVLLQSELNMLEQTLQKRLQQSQEYRTRAESDLQNALNENALAVSAAAAATTAYVGSSRPPLPHGTGGAASVRASSPHTMGGVPPSPTMHRAPSPTGGQPQQLQLRYGSQPGSPMVHHHGPGLTSAHSTPHRQQSHHMQYPPQPMQHVTGGAYPLMLSEDFQQQSGYGYAPSPYAHSHQHAHRAPSRPRSHEFEERLQKAHEVLRLKKKEFKEKQAKLEQLRVDWKKDMSKAKARRDVDTVQTLMDVLDVLEADARRLNKEAVSLKQSVAWLKKEEQAYAAETGTAVPQPVAMARPSSALGNNGQGGDLLGMLQAMMDRVESVEAMLQQSQQQQATRTATPNRHGTPHRSTAAAQQHHHNSKSKKDQPKVNNSRPAAADSRRESGDSSDPMTGKWTTWLQSNNKQQQQMSTKELNRQQQRMTTYVDPLMMAGEAGGGAGSPKKRDVEQWLRDQQRNA